MTETARRHDIDALRVLAVALLILYHCGMLYVSDWHWHLKSSHQSEWLHWPMMALNRWRMELLFLVSGLAMNFMRRSGGSVFGFISLRSKRLLLPLLVGMLVIVPLQPYCQAVGNGSIEPGFVHFLIRYFSFQSWPRDAFDGWQFGITYNHLWYLPYLWFYTLALAPLLPWLESVPGLHLRERCAGLRGWALLTLPALPLWLSACALQERFGTTNDLIHDWFMHAEYFALFMYGYLIGTQAPLWRELERLRWISLGLAVLACVAYLGASEVAGDGTPHWSWNILRLLRWAYCWLAICTLLGWAHRHLNRPFRWLPYACEAVYPWYVLHQSLIVLAAYWLVPLKLAAPLEALLVFTATVLGCALLHHVLIRRSRWLRPCFGLPAERRAPHSRSTSTAPPAVMVT